MSAATTQWLASERVLGAICLCLLAGTLIAGLWPFNPSPRNDVSWLGNQGGLHLGPAGIVLSSGNFQWARSSTAAWTLEIWLRPDRNTGVNDILNFYSPEAPQRLRLFKWKDSTLLLYRDFRSQHGEIDIDDAFHPGAPLLITIAAGSQGTAIYLNGVLAQQSADLTLSMGDVSGQLVLGTSPVEDNHWAGELRRIAFYGVELTGAQVSRHSDAWRRGVYPAIEASDDPVAIYAFNEGAGRVVHDQMDAQPDLYIPESYLIPHKTLLLMPWEDFRYDWNTVQDVAINLAGFAVLGFFFCAYLMLKSRSEWVVVGAVISGGALSLAIEIVQVYLPTRTSSMTDVMMNTAGMALGALLCKSKLARAVLR